MSSSMTLPFSLLDNLSLNLEVIEWLGELAMNLLGSASTFQLVLALLTVTVMPAFLHGLPGL